MLEPVTTARLLSAGYLRPLDAEFARTMLQFDRQQRAGEPSEAARLVELAAALVSRHVSEGHVCLPIPSLCQAPPRIMESRQDGGVEPLRLQWPEASQLLSALSESALTATAAADAATPLVLDAEGRLYLRRYFEHEQALVADVLQRLSAAPDAPASDASLDRLFPPTATGATGDLPGQEPQLLLGQAVDLQRQAVAMALQRRFAVMTGGPGTGKTATVVKLLALWLEAALASGHGQPRIHLLAPTGKAAARLSESIARQVAGLVCTPEVRAAMPTQASTIHRALGPLSVGRLGFRHHAGHPLPADLVVVDEASMVDLALMRRLLTAIPAEARVVLLGDRDQLSSVEAGAVLGDLCGAGLPPERRRGSAMAACHVHLTRSYRYRADSGIGRLAEAIRRRRASDVLALLHRSSLRDVSLHAPPTPGDLGGPLRDLATSGYRRLCRARQPAPAFAALDGFRVLCAHRHGPSGVLALNALIEQALRAQGLLPEDPRAHDGRPVIVNQNDYALRRFNGDVGVLLRPDAGPLRAFFREESAEADGEAFRRLSPRRLPPHEPVYAMSVHRSQGSEMDSVAIVLPPVGSPLLTRELLYTAVTRARKRVALFATPEAVVAAVETSIARESGLQARLWHPSVARPE